MKSFIKISIYLASMLLAFEAQGQDPRLSTAGVFPRPTTIAPGATSMCLVMVNNSTSPIRYDAFNPVRLTISTSRFIPTATPASLTGDGLQYYNWNWECKTACEGGNPSEVWSLTGTQNAVVPGKSGPFDVVGGEFCWTGQAIATEPTEVSPTFGVGFNANLAASATRDIDRSNESNNTSTYTFTVDATAPVTLVSFDAVRKEDVAEVSWATGTEINSSHFEVERSLDGTSFEKIAQVDAAGESLKLLSYVIEDSEILKLGVDRIYYRLRAVDLDGSYEYSGIKSISLGKSEFEMYPNPVSTSLVTIRDVEGISELQVRDVDGRVMMTRDYQSAPKVTMSVRDLAPGMYYVQINNSRVERLVVL